MGRLMSDDPKEEERQREFKSLLNKLTPEKYQVIFQKMLEVWISSPLTLQGLINQVRCPSPSLESDFALCLTKCLQTNGLRDTEILYWTIPSFCNANIVSHTGHAGASQAQAFMMSFKSSVTHSLDERL